METETKETIPLWLAVAITVVVSLPFGLYLSKIGGGVNLMNLPLWVAFIVWAEYFALGAKPDALKTIIPAFSLSVILTGATMWLYVILNDRVPKGSPDGTALAIALFIGVGAMVYIMRFWPVLQTGSLPFFNGISMLLGVYFTGSIPATATRMPTWRPWSPHCGRSSPGSWVRSRLVQRHHHLPAPGLQFQAGDGRPRHSTDHARCPRTRKPLRSWAGTSTGSNGRSTP